MWEEVSKDRFEELNKMVNYLESRNNVWRKWWAYAEGSVEGCDIFCTTTHKPLMTLSKDGVTQKYYMKED